MRGKKEKGYFLLSEIKIKNCNLETRDLNFDIKFRRVRESNKNSKIRKDVRETITRDKNLLGGSVIPVG